MRRHAVAASLVVTVALASAVSANASASPSFFPLADGKRWVLFDGNGAERRIAVARAGTVFTLQGFPGLGSTRVRARDGNIEAWDDRSSRWEPFLRLAAPTGTRYTVDLGDATLWRRVEVTIASRSASCLNALGRTVHGCVRLTLRARSPIADAGIERLVFAPGVGLAEIVEQTIAGPRRYTLSRPLPTS
jgi:hypothetical protein